MGRKTITLFSAVAVGFAASPVLAQDDDGVETFYSDQCFMGISDGAKRSGDIGFTQASYELISFSKKIAPHHGRASHLKGPHRVKITSARIDWDIYMACVGPSGVT